MKETLHTVLPKLDDIKVRFDDDFSLKQFMINSSTKTGLRINESKWGKAPFLNKGEFYLRMTKKVFIEGDFYELYYSYSNPLGVELEINKDEFMHILEYTPIVFNSNKYEWKSLYGKYIYPHLYS